MNRPRKLVMAGLLERDGAFLLARRPEGAHLAGLWEFPGGKLEAGESPEQCLARELREELGLEAKVGEVFMVVFHRYDDFDLLMLLYRCEAGPACPQALGCSEWRWVRPSEMGALEFPPADGPIVEKLLTAG
jgi:8-oxo-dGTP diphosphatase